MTKAALFVLLLACAYSSSAQTDRYGSRKPACGCYVCGKLLAVTFPNAGDCAGILATEACGNYLENLPGHERQAYCDKIKAELRFSSFETSCREYAGTCGSGTSSSTLPRPSSPGSALPPDTASAPVPPAPSAPGAPTSPPREALISPHAAQPQAGEREWFTRPGEGSAGSPQGAASPATSTISPRQSAGEPNRSQPAGTAQPGGQTRRAPGQVGAPGCYIGGCSGQVCSDRPDVVTTCVWRPEYACYANAECRRQASGACGWTPTPALEQCLSNPP